VIDVVHVVTSLEVGGTQRMLAKLLSRQPSGRVRSRVVSLIDGGAVAAELERGGTPVHGLGMRRGRPRVRAMLRLRRHLAEWRPDLVLTWLYHADLLGTLAARWAGVERVAWNVRCTAPRPGDGSAGGMTARAAPRLCALLSRLPEAVLVNSRVGRSSHEAIGYRPRRWVHVPNGFDLARFAPDGAARRARRAELGLGEEDVALVVVARLDPLKNHGAVLEALERLAERSPRLRLLLVGAGLSGDHPPFARLLERSPARDRVIPLGERADVPAWLNASDVLVSASTAEGFPNAVGEALACGVPVVATDVGECAEIVGGAGVLVAPGSASKLAAGIERLAALAPAERRALGAEGRRRMEERYELGAVAERYAELWEELAGGVMCAV